MAGSRYYAVPLLSSFFHCGDRKGTIADFKGYKFHHMFAEYVKNYTLEQQNTRHSVTVKQHLKRIFVPNLVLHTGAAKKRKTCLQSPCRQVPADIAV
jgi:hypothetical protein